MSPNRSLLLVASLGLSSGCALFSSLGAKEPAPAAPAASTSAAPGATTEDQAPADTIVDFSGLSEGAAHPALSRFVGTMLTRLDYDRELMSPLLAIHVGGTAASDVDPAVVYRHAAGRAVANGIRLAEECGAPRFAEQLTNLPTFAAAGDFETPAAEVSGWAAAGASEVEHESGEDAPLQTSTAKGCVREVGKALSVVFDAGAALPDGDGEPNAVHQTGRDIVRGWGEVIRVGQSIGSPYDVVGESAKELQALLAVVKTGKSPKLAKVKAKPVHPAILLQVEHAQRDLDAAQWAELVGVDVSDTARGSNIDVLVYAADLAAGRFFAELLDACGSGNAAESVRGDKVPKIRKPADVDKVFGVVDALINDHKREDRLCVQKAWRPIGETLGELSEAASHKRADINQTLPYADRAFSEWHYIVEDLHTDKAERFELTMALLKDSVRAIKKMKRRPAKDMVRLED
ncbi:MAG: hypothetical protein AAF721_24525 [Myxococcota bacterium]